MQINSYPKLKLNKLSFKIESQHIFLTGFPISDVQMLFDTEGLREVETEVTDPLD